ncbi:HK97-gp10 family putative phage morphogenesis protein [Devosia sp.]|uniref:HK97-gp10 family putative phage morphogenesis protein n=1 Tax=Devosia sp. TaxID=1871048 RepID=UPI001B129E7E|nr:HK97-gp10 family putative phage morphogenesis protein [Devosia sp.]MBO9589068.1 HK97 gp10 family phage protein [Devosia sp.]
MKVTVKVDGLTAIDAALDQFTPTKRRAIGRKALDNAGQILARSMRDKAPEGKGYLKESIDVGGVLAPGPKSAHPKVAEQERYVGPDSRPQAVQQEFGNENHPPQPFARPAWDETQKEVLDRIGDELWLGIERAATAAARKAAKGK